MKGSLPANVRLVLPEDSVNAYSLAEEADVGLTFGSTIGLEMAMMGKPVLLASRALYEYGSQISTVRCRESLPGMLEKCLQVLNQREIQREAFRLAHCYLASELPFPAIKVLGLYEAERNYNLEDLAPGKDYSLDRICNFLVESHPLFDCPTTEERSRTTAEEDAFFEELAHSPDFLRHVGYERGLQLRSLGRSTTRLLRRLPLGAGEALLNLGRSRWHNVLAWVETKHG
jgi:hypothetical protein